MSNQNFLTEDPFYDLSIQIDKKHKIFNGGKNSADRSEKGSNGDGSSTPSTTSVVGSFMGSLGGWLG